MPLPGISVWSSSIAPSFAAKSSLHHKTTPLPVSSAMIAAMDADPLPIIGSDYVVDNSGVDLRKVRIGHAGLESLLSASGTIARRMMY